MQQPQNTDPFVFGDTFLYSCCKQVRRNGSATLLRKLQRGDVILFGSRLDGRFVLDTVFVVARSEIFETNRGVELLTGRVPAEFVETVLRPLARASRLEPRGAEADLRGCGPEEWAPEDEEYAACAAACAPVGTQYRLYWGATPDDPVDGMFSFAPAQLAEHAPAGFRRPAIDAHFINANLRGFKTCLEDEDGNSSHQIVKAAWEKVVSQVIQQNHLLGFQFALPEWERDHA
ncbi:hypothetical protein WMF31_06205 [Sorangium sp. So ce1036]|uniref:hypothetical protein n=1 Tax=Sorangium sp. So ce1036 TaxID=3133328 RepID=UPI003F119C42